MAEEEKNDQTPAEDQAPAADEAPAAKSEDEADEA